ncbi:hypothetical protein V6N13_092673 [Hibiscus sabdariffa]
MIILLRVPFNSNTAAETAFLTPPKLVTSGDPRTVCLTPDCSNDGSHHRTSKRSNPDPNSLSVMPTRSSQASMNASLTSTPPFKDKTSVAGIYTGLSRTTLGVAHSSFSASLETIVPESSHWHTKRESVLTPLPELGFDQTNPSPQTRSSPPLVPNDQSQLEISHAQNSVVLK